METRDAARRGVTLRLLRLFHLMAFAACFGGLLGLGAILGAKAQFASGEDLFLLDLAAYEIFRGAVTWGYGVLLLTGLAYSATTGVGLRHSPRAVLKWVGAIFLGLGYFVWGAEPLHGMVALADGNLPDMMQDYPAYTMAVLQAVLVGLGALAALAALSAWRRFELPTWEGRVANVARLVAALLLVGAVAAGVWYRGELESFRELEVGESDASVLPDGTYRGEYDCAGTPYVVEVKLSEGEIDDVEVLEGPDSTFARFGEGVLGRIIANQTPNVDAVAGATVSSKCLMKAVERALRGLGPGTGLITRRRDSGLLAALSGR